MAKSSGKWVQSVKCWNCNKTGKIPNPDDPEKEIKCPICNHGFIITTGILSS